MREIQENKECSIYFNRLLKRIKVNDTSKRNSYDIAYILLDKKMLDVERMRILLCMNDEKFLELLNNACNK
jgi:transcriptional regulator CtsR